MSVRSAQAVTVDFTTASPTTGAAANADSTPTGTLVVNGTDDAAAVTVTNKSTGVYKAAVTLPTLAVGDRVQLRVAATVGGVAAKEYVWEDTKDVLLDSSGKTTDSVQTGDSFARIGSAGAGLTAVAPAATALSTAQWANARAGYLDNLNVGGIVPTAAAVAQLVNLLLRPILLTEAVTGNTSGLDNYYLYDGDYNGYPSWGGGSEVFALWLDTGGTPFAWVLSTSKGTRGSNYFYRTCTPFSGDTPDAPWDDGSRASELATFQGVGTYNGRALALRTGDRADLVAVNAKTTNLPGSPAAVGSAMTLAANQDVRNVLGTLTTTERNAIADALLDRADAVETGLTPRGHFRLVSAAAAGKLSGAGGSTVAIRNAVQDSKARITATVDANGNRSAITWDVT
jgi:hypothetical protein